MTRNPVVAVMHWHKDWIGVACPHGYSVTMIRLDREFAGSMAECQLGLHGAGMPNLYDRLAADTCRFHQALEGDGQ